MELTLTGVSERHVDTLSGLMSSTKPILNLIHRHVHQRWFLERIVIGFVASKELVDHHLHLNFGESFTTRNGCAGGKCDRDFLARIKREFLIKASVFLEHRTQHFLLVTNINISRHTIDNCRVSAQKFNTKAHSLDNFMKLFQK